MSKIEKFKMLGDRVARSPKTRRWGLRVLIALVVIGVLGFLVAPPIVKYVLEKQASAALLRPVTVDSVRVNPYTLALTLRGVRVLEKEGGKLLAGFDELYVNADLMSVFRAAPVVSALRVSKPQLRLVRLEANRYNISDIIDAFLAKPESPTPRFALFNIEIVGGEISLEDRVVKETHVVSELVLRLPFISSLPAFAKTDVEPFFSAFIDGSPLVLKGATRPFDESLESALTLALDRFDLAKFNDYLPAQLPLRPAAGMVDGELRLDFRQHASKPAEVTLSGHLAVQGLALHDQAGKSFATLQTLELALDKADLQHRQLLIKQVALEGLSVQSTIAGKAGLQVQSFAALGIALDVDKQQVTVQQFDTRAVQAQLARLANGQISWLANLPLPASSALSSPAAGAKPESSKDATSWQFTLAQLNVVDAKFQFEDQKTRPFAKQSLVVNALTVENLTTQSGQPATLNLQAQINNKGVLKTQGSFQWAPLKADLALEAAGIELLPLQPYFNDKVSMTVTRGQIAAKGQLNVRAEEGGEEGVQGTYQGDLTLGEFAAMDRENSVDFLRLKSFHFGGVKIESAPLNLSVDEVALSDFYSRLVISAQGKLNLMQLIRPAGAQDPAPEVVVVAESPADASVPTPATATASTVPLATTSAPAIPVRIGKVTLQGGTIHFTDNFIKPNYSARLTRVGGRITGLSSVPESTADMDLRGSYDNLAPITVIGKVNPLAAKPALDIKAEVKGVDMTPFSPYSARYAGYGIEKGKLSLFVNYKIENQQLSADNRIFLDQLSFGEEAVGEGAGLPVKLAVALLQNRKGEIDINLPISGSLDDPEFSIGGIVVKVILNLFVKAVTSPFALIGSLFGGGGEEMSSLEFDPGRALITASGKTKLENLAKVLNDRPALKLEVAGRLDRERDSEAYKSAQIEHKVRSLKLKETAGKGVEANRGEIEIDPKEYPALLEKVYRAETFPKPRNVIGLVKSLPVAEMEKLILANTQVSDDDLRQLANRRTQRVRDFLVNQANVPGERVFLVPPKLDKGEAKSGESGKVSSVIFSLR